MAGFRYSSQRKLVFNSLEDAIRKGIDKTAAAIVITAKRNVKPRTITGTLQGSIAMRPAKIDGAKVRGEVGSYDVNYAAFQEFAGAQGPISTPGLQEGSRQIA